MARLKLTALGVERIRPPETGRVEYFDTLLAGFGLRVTAKGSKSWAVVYRMGGRGQNKKRVTLGSYPAMSLAEAREAAKEALHQVSQSIDPGEVRRERQNAQQERDRDTVAVVVKEFIERHAKAKNKAWKEVQRVLEREVVALWGDRPIGGITRRDVLGLLDSVVDRGSPYMANRLLAHTRKLFNWSMERGIIDASPVAGVKPPGKEQSRERVLTDAEAVAVWRGCEGLGFPFGPIFRLLLATGQRRSEVAGMRRQDIDLGKKLWTIPGSLTKAGRPQEVPLSDLAVQIIEDVPPFVGTLMFAPPSAANPPSGYGRAKGRLDKVLAKMAEDEEAVAVEPWRLHDLRRTAASGMARLGVAPQVLSRILNHAPGASMGVTAIYNRHGYESEKRHAMDLWARHLEGLLNPSDNVVMLRQSGE